MTYNPDIHHRHSIRLRNYDYSRNGAYFVTICVQARECLLGMVVEGTIRLNYAGRLVEEIWSILPKRFAQIELDEYVIMPNHFHGIVVMHENGVGKPVGAIHELPLPHDGDVWRKYRRDMLLPKIIGYFKMNSAKRINVIRDNRGCPVWQRNYYERIIRDDAELNAVRKYIIENPMKWAEDSENPNNIK